MKLQKNIFNVILRVPCFVYTMLDEVQLRVCVFVCVFIVL